MDFETYIRRMADAYLTEGPLCAKWTAGSDEERSAAWKLVLPLLEGQLKPPAPPGNRPALEATPKIKTRR